MNSPDHRERIPCVGAIVRDQAGRLLLIRRGHPPGKGLWSLPGGRVDPGESDEAAVVREVREEAGLDVRVGHLIGTAEVAEPDGAVFDIRDYAATVSGGTLHAGDDASDARWVTYEQLADLPLVERLFETLAAWNALPSQNTGGQGTHSG